MQVRYIKLGNGGEWAEECLERDQTIRLGYESGLHDECTHGNWDVVRQFWVNARKGSEQTASNDLRQIRDFYELSENDYWITFHNRKLYWCNAAKGVEQLDDGTHIRKVIGKWSSNNKSGDSLNADNLDGRVLKVQAYRGTICGLSNEMEEYVVRKILGEDEPAVVETKKSLSSLQGTVAELIKGLWWNDFELLVDLIFSRTGWHRYAVVGKTVKDIDLDIFSPSTNRRAFVQIKSSTSVGELRRYLDVYEGHRDQYHEFFFVFHTGNENLKETFTKDSHVHVWDLNDIAKLTIQTGLVDWLISKRS